MKSFKLFAFVIFTTALLCSCGHWRKNTIEFYLDGNEKTETFKKLAEKFSDENEGKYTVNLFFSDGDAKSFLRGLSERKRLPDIIAIGGNSSFTRLVEDGGLVDFSGDRILEGIHPNYIDQISLVSGRKAGSVYGVPYSANASGIICNTEVFEKYSVPLPRTWDELMAACKIFKSKKVAPFEMTLDENDSWTVKTAWNSLVPILIDDDFISRRYKKETSFFKECGEVLEKYCAILDYTTGDILSTSYIEGCRNFSKGNAAMLINGSWTVPVIKRFNPEIKVDIIPFPGSNDIEKNCVNSGLDVILAVSETSKHKKEAVKFIDFLISPENAQFYIDEQYAFSAVKGVEQNDLDAQEILEFIEEGKIADYPDHYYPDSFDLTSLLMDFVRNKQKKIPNRQNISVTLLNFDRSFDSILSTRTTIVE